MEISQLFHNTENPISIKDNNQLVTKHLNLCITIEIFNTGFSLINRHCGFPIRIGLIPLNELIKQSQEKVMKNAVEEEEARSCK